MNLSGFIGNMIRENKTQIENYIGPNQRKNPNQIWPISASAAAVKMVKGRQGERVRLYVRGTILGYKRSKSNQYPNTSLVQIEGVNTKEEVAWYAGKRLAYIYKAKVKKNGTHYRCLWGKVTRPHGNSGIVRAKFTSNLPPKSMGSRIRVFMYPSNI
ncbi:60S ribosomal protein L35a-1 [Lathyrus oleraceus]|uniref:60S ribosomal protein L35a-1 n=2 Tax=Pisum sativum TaxID=3888 RepID=A0A9D5AX33_PEA|nr:60S ribosomal protein L35a-1 [Pisum sativum]